MWGDICSQTLEIGIPFCHLHFVEKPPMALNTAVLTQDDLKHIAAHHAINLVQSGMVLGTGSTTAHALDLISDLLHSGLLSDIVDIPTSKKTEAHAVAVGIPLSNLDAHPVIDLSINGADEVDPWLNLVKGHDGSLLREKMIEGANKQFIVIVDESKMVPYLGGSSLAISIEVVPFGWSYTHSMLCKLFVDKPSFDTKLRTFLGEDDPFVTDN